MAENENVQDAGLGFEIPESALADDGDDEPGASDDETTADDDDDERPDNVDANGEIISDNGSDRVTPEDLDKANKQSITRFKVYANSITGYYEGLPVTLFECPLCPDQHKGFVDMRQAGRIPQEIQDAVRGYFGIAREQNYAHTSLYHTCETCEGKGKVATGSTVPEHQTVICPACGGRGYESLERQGVPVASVLTGPTVYTPEAPATQAYDEVDEWDEPRILPDGRENPNFGKMPNRKIPVEPWGQTAGLNALSA